MHPLIGAALITGAGGLVGGLLGGAQKAKERKTSKKDYMELLQKRIGMVKGEFKPTQARYNIERDLPGWDKFMKKAILGSYGTAFGQEGAEMPSAADFMSQMAQGFTPQGMPYAQKMMRGGGADMQGGMDGAMNDMMRRRHFGRDTGLGRGGREYGGGYERY